MRRNIPMDQLERRAFEMGAMWAFHTFIEPLRKAVETARSFMLEEDIRHYTQAIRFEDMYFEIKKKEDEIGKN